MGNPSSYSTDAFETIAFLAGSPYRIELLDALADRGPLSRSELVDAVGSSRVTVGRTLDSFVERGWVLPTGQCYQTTPAGELVADLFSSLCRTVESLEVLSTVAPWLPADFDVDLQRLATASVTVPTWSDSVAPVRRAGELCANCTELRVAASGVAPDVIHGFRDAAVEGGADVEVTLTSESLGVALTDREMTTAITEMVDAGAALFEHPGHQYLLGVYDDTAMIGMNDELGVPRGLVESSDEAVVDWVVTTIDRCRSEATPVTDISAGAGG